MQCTSCQLEVAEGARFCSGCGTALASEPTPDPEIQARLAALVQEAGAQIDQFMREIGIATPGEVTDEQGWRYLNAGSAQGRVGIVADGETLYFQVESVVMPLPSDGELIVPLMRELLEFNMTIAGSARLGIRDESVFMLAAHALPLDQGFITGCINNVLLLADQIDDQLSATYGGTAKSRGKGGKRTRRS